MQTCSKIIGSALIALAILLLTRAPLHAQQESPWSFLEDFGFVRGAVGPVQGGYVAAVLYDPAKNLFALVIFRANVAPKAAP